MIVTRIYQLMQITFGDVTVSQAEIFEWSLASLFYEGQTPIRSDRQPGNPSNNRNGNSVAEAHDSCEMTGD
jgi:hypothetical protein